MCCILNVYNKQRVKRAFLKRSSICWCWICFICLWLWW